jgi:hypothetical protein
MIDCSTTLNYRISTPPLLFQPDTGQSAFIVYKGILNVSPYPNIHISHIHVLQNSRYSHLLLILNRQLE